MNPEIDKYLEFGCGRCALGGTPECKVYSWPEILVQLRRILLECGLTEELKWSMPCYTFNGGNVLILSAFKDFASLNFFKGSLLKDPHNRLEKPGPNSQASRFFKFTKVEKVMELETVIREYVFEAMEIEKAGLKVQFKKELEPMPEELQMAIGDDPGLEAAWEALTPGRKRSYILHISGAKQAKTRANRVQKCAPKIFEGKGFNER